MPLAGCGGDTLNASSTKAELASTTGNPSLDTHTRTTTKASGTSTSHKATRRTTDTETMHSPTAS